MKILMFCQLFPPAIYGGGEVVFFNWARELCKRGVEVNVVTQKLKGTKDFEVLEGINVYRVGPSIDYSGSLYSVNTKQNMGFFVSAVLKGLKLAKNMDLVHSNTFIPALVGNFVSKLSRKPHLITVFDVYLQGRKNFWKKWSVQKDVSKLISGLGPLVEKWIINIKCKMIHTSSETSKEDLIEAGVKTPIHVIPLGLDLSKYRNFRIKKKDQFVFVGRHVFYKNVDTVIKAFKGLKSKFIIIGDGPMNPAWRELAKDSKNIVFTGRITEVEKQRIIRESKALILPSLVEGFGMVVLEAWALGSPVIVSNVMPLPELVKQGINGFVVKPFDVKDWTRIIKKLGDNPKLINEFTRNGFKSLKEKYTNEKSVDGILRLYKELV